MSEHVRDTKNLCTNLSWTKLRNYSKDYFLIIMDSLYTNIDHREGPLKHVSKN